MGVEEINGLLEVTHEQEYAMLMGSMFGWDSPSADPITWEKDRKFQAKLLSQGKQNAKKMRESIAKAKGQ